MLKHENRELGLNSRAMFSAAVATLLVQNDDKDLIKARCKAYNY